MKYGRRWLVPGEDSLVDRRGVRQGFGGEPDGPGPSRVEGPGHHDGGGQRDQDLPAKQPGEATPGKRRNASKRARDWQGTGPPGLRALGRVLHEPDSVAL